MIRTPEAKQLCTKTEFQLFQHSLSRNIKRLTQKELQSSVTRARTARDKYRSLANRQKREARGKQTSKGNRASQGAQNTIRKQQLFAETLDRYQQQLADVKKKSATDATKKSTKKSASPKSKTNTTSRKSSTAKKTTGQKTTGVKKKAVRKKKNAKTPLHSKTGSKKKKKVGTATKTTASLRQRKKAGGHKRKLTHLSASGKRNQARRDSR